MSNPPTPGSELGRVGTSDQRRAGLKPQRRPYTNHLSLVTNHLQCGRTCASRIAAPRPLPHYASASRRPSKSFLFVIPVIWSRNCPFLKNSNEGIARILYLKERL